MMREISLSIDLVPVETEWLRHNFILKDSTVRRSLISTLNHVYYNDLDGYKNKNWDIGDGGFDSRGSCIFKITHNETGIELWASCADMFVREWFVYISKKEYKKLSKL